MNPKEFNWAEDQQVTVRNPTDEPYRWMVHAKTYEIGPGKAAKIPGYIAWVYVYNMASRLCQQAGQWNRWNEEGYRAEWFDKVVVRVDELLQIVEAEDEPDVMTFSESDDDLDDETTDPPAGQGSNYTPSVKAAKAK